MRIDGNTRHVFISHVNKPRDYDVAQIENYVVSFNGTWRATLLDSMTGKRIPLAVEYRNGQTSFKWACGCSDSLLLELEYGLARDGATLEQEEYTASYCPAHEAEYELSEPNVLLLDRFAYSVDGGEFKPETDVLKADDDIRKQLGIRVRGGGMAQPWLVPYDRNPSHSVTLCARFDSQIEYTGALLGIESHEYARVLLNGQAADMTVTGYYVDKESIKTVALPPIRKGENELRVEYRFGDVTQIESMYLLGDFGVICAGLKKTVCTRAPKLAFGDIVPQTLPFYGGNITYKLSLTAAAGRRWKFRATAEPQSQWNWTASAWVCPRSPPIGCRWANFARASIR